MILLDRYLAQIKRHLPKSDKEDTINELKSLILENYDIKLEEGLSEEDAMYNAIKEFGRPRDVAKDYRDDQPMLSKEIEPLVFLILKIVSITLPGSITLATIIDYYTSNDTTSTMGLLLEIAYSIPSIMTTLLSVLAVIYLVFIFIDRKVNLKFDIRASEFEPKYLPLIPVEKFKISRFEMIFNILGGILFLYLFNLQPGLISINYEGVHEPLLNSNFDKILPLLNVSIFISIGYSITFLVKGARTKLSSSVEFFGKIFSAVILIFLANGNIFNDAIINGFDLSIVPNIYKIVMIIIAVITIISAIVVYLKIMISTPE